VPPAEVVIIGAGVVGTFATRAFLGLDAHVTVLDNNLRALQIISERFSCVTMISNPANIARACAYADVIIGAVLVPGEPPPIVVTRSVLHNMKERSVVVDVSIDEGGCIETSRPTTHEHPTFIEEGLIHYCVPNMPSIVTRTATHAFLNAAFPFIFEIANKGVEKTISDNPSLKLGVGTYRGEIENISTVLPRQQME